MFQKASTITLGAGDTQKTLSKEKEDLRKSPQNIEN